MEMELIIHVNILKFEPQTEDLPPIPIGNNYIGKC